MSTTPVSDGHVLLMTDERVESLFDKIVAQFASMSNSNKVFIITSFGQLFSSFQFDFDKMDQKRKLASALYNFDYPEDLCSICVNFLFSVSYLIQDEQTFNIVKNLVKDITDKFIHEICKDLNVVSSCKLWQAW